MSIEKKQVLNQTIKDDIEKDIYEFLSEEGEIDLNEITPESRIIDDLDGDSLLMVELIEVLKEKYNLDIELQVVGKYMLKNPVDTVHDLVNTFYLVYEYGNDITEL